MSSRTLVQGVKARGTRELPVARSTAHLGLVACATGNAALRLAGNDGLGDGEDGAPVCALSRGASRGLRRYPENSWHNPGTVIGAAKTARIMSTGKGFFGGQGGN